jgi:hypothetical protein
MSKAKKKKAAANKLPVKPRGIAKKSNPAVDKKTSGIQRSLFPIVGIGASAGGIEAFQQLLEELPANLGMAYVFVQHLSPDHQSYLPEILVRKTKMNVYTATHGMKVHKDTVYVIPPDNSITINDGTLQLTKRSKDHRNFHPIDDFLTSLASAYKETAIGIILSGTATDGTEGHQSRRRRYLFTGRHGCISNDASLSRRNGVCRLCNAPCQDRKGIGSPGTLSLRSHNTKSVSRPAQGRAATHPYDPACKTKCRFLSL